MVDVGALGVGAAWVGALGVVDAVADDGELPVAGDGDTIETVLVELDDVGARAVTVELDDVVVGEDDPEAGGAGLELSLGTALANGLRAMRASTTLAGSPDRECAGVPVAE